MNAHKKPPPVGGGSGSAGACHPTSASIASAPRLSNAYTQASFNIYQFTPRNGAAIYCQRHWIGRLAAKFENVPDTQLGYFFKAQAAGRQLNAYRHHKVVQGYGWRRNSFFTIRHGSFLGRN
jgi:hypothetical protein